MKNNRYLIDFDIKKLNTKEYDVIIIGAGIAGVYTALCLPDNYKILLVSKESLDISNSVLAQGGIAASLDKEDSPKLHFEDTVFAGSGLCNEESVWVLVNEAVENIENICNYGVRFDRERTNELSLTREGAHSKNRIIHSGDNTGEVLCKALYKILKKKKNIYIKEKNFCIDILTNHNRCEGVLVYDERLEENNVYLSSCVICATGGFGQIYERTTNPTVSTGDGIAMAYRAGAELMDLEFVQFHPTVLHVEGNNDFLISEAVRGEGATLKNVHNERFMYKYHELLELAPRDVVSRAIFNEMKKTSHPCVYLDVTHLSDKYLRKRFPNIYKTCMGYGIIISKDYIPVSPAEHYCMGGIRVDTYGRTSIDKLYSCGESACNGIHGANRLASNSLLEGLVFGNKIAGAIKQEFEKYKGSDVTYECRCESHGLVKNLNKKKLRNDLKSIMTEYVGIVRIGKNLLKAKEKLDGFYELLRCSENKGIEEYELNNMLTVARLVTESALKREESRGAHYREDFPNVDDEIWKKNIIRKK